MPRRNDEADRNSLTLDERELGRHRSAFSALQKISLKRFGERVYSHRYISRSNCSYREICRSLVDHLLHFPVDATLISLYEIIS
jgi:hypothetical protein